MLAPGEMDVGVRPHSMFEAGPVAVVMDVDEPSRKSELFVLPQAPEPSCAVSNYELIEKVSLLHKAQWAIDSQLSDAGRITRAPS